jgi:hypothetical protein
MGRALPLIRDWLPKAAAVTACDRSGKRGVDALGLAVRVQWRLALTLD